jgi:hypothetical protein
MTGRADASRGGCDGAGQHDVAIVRSAGARPGRPGGRAVLRRGVRVSDPRHRDGARDRAGEDRWVQGDNSAIPIDVSATGFARLRLLFPSRKDDEIFLLAPSHVPSPPIKGAGLAILEVIDSGYTSAQTNLQVARQLGAHAYFDEA